MLTVPHLAAITIAAIAASCALFQMVPAWRELLPASTWTVLMSTATLSLAGAAVI